MISNRTSSICLFLFSWWKSDVLYSAVCYLTWYLTSWIEKLVNNSWLVLVDMNGSDLCLKWLILIPLITYKTRIYKWILTYSPWVGCGVTKCFFSYCYVVRAILVWASPPLIGPLSYPFLCSICWLENEAWQSKVGVPLIFDQNLLHRRILQIIWIH